MTLNQSINKLNNDKKLKIVALGDSLTYGWMVNKGYLDFLYEFLIEKYPKCDISVINKGISGNTARDGLMRVSYDVINQNPDLVFIQFALNDAYSDCSAHEYKENILGIISEIKSKTNAEILLVTSSALEKDEMKMVKDFYTALIEIAKANNIAICLVHKYWENKILQGISFYDLVKDDLVHPTELGYQFMAEAIFDQF